MVSAEVADLQHKIARLARPERTIDRPVVRRQQVLDGLAIVFESVMRADDLQDAMKLLLGGIDDRNLVRNAADEGSIDELFRFQVR